jgi:hypothetical protein
MDDGVHSNPKASNPTLRVSKLSTNFLHKLNSPNSPK